MSWGGLAELDADETVADVIHEWELLEAQVPGVDNAVPLCGSQRSKHVASGWVCPCCTTHDYWLHGEKENYRKPFRRRRSHKLKTLRSHRVGRAA